MADDPLMQGNAIERDALARIDAAAEIERLRGLDGRALNQSFIVVTYAPDGRIRSANFQFLRLFGCALGEVVGHDATRFLSKSVQRKRLAAQWARLLEGERRREVGLWITAAGREVWLDSRLIPVLDAAGRAEAVVQIAEDVSDRLERETEARGQVEAIAATHAVAHFTLDGRLQWANGRFVQASGYTLDELLGQPHARLVDAAGREPRDAAFWDALRAGRPQSGEFRRVRKDGSDLWLQAVYTPILDPAGRPVKVVSYATDISAEKRRQADFRWQVEAIHTSSCVVAFDMHGAILDANARFLEATGYTLDEVRGCHHRMFVEPTQALGADYARFWQDLRRGQHHAGLYKRCGKGGRELWLQATYNPIFDATGRPVKVLKYATVVTDERLLQAEYQGQIAAIHNAQCVIAFDLDGRILDANENFLTRTGYRWAEVRGQHHRLFVPPDEAASQAYADFWRDLAQGHHRAGEYKRLGKDGREIWLQATYNPIRDLGGRVFKVVKYATDITAEKLRQADHQGQIEAIHKAQDVLVFALDGTIIDANARILATLGYGREELVGRHHAMLVERDVAASADYQAFWQALKAGQHHEGLYKRLGKGGKEVWIQASYNPILDLNGRPTKVVKFATDVSANVALAEAYAEARRQALLDAVTSLPNRSKLTAFLGTHLADAGAAMAVLYLDLDHFGHVNERLGHRMGDRVLGEVADRLRRLLREDQMVARVGGDEFVVAAPGMDAAGVEALCQALLHKVAEPIVGLEGEEATIGLSIGVAMAPADGRTPDELLRAADAALAHAKRQGRGSHAYCSQETNARLRGQRQLIDEMRHSFTAGHFYLDYQPRFDTASRRIRSVEALVRWMHPERGRIAPVEFIGLAEQSGFIVRLGQWILQQACQTAMRWPDVGVSVNLSPVQFNDDALVHKVSAALAQSGLAPHRLELEVTEGVLMADGQRALDLLTALKATGVRLAIDDFGTGYSSLSYLRDFPFDVIKLDRSFVRDLGAASNSRPIVQAILALGRALGLSVTAEGVETPAQLELLAADGCDEVQGYLLAMPSAAEAIDALVAPLRPEQ